MRRAALFVSRFLQYSQTFVYEELRAHERYAVDVFTRTRENAERFPWPAPAVHIAEPYYKYSTYSRHFHRIFETQHFDLLHAHFGTAGVYAMRYARVHKLPLAVTFHGFDVPMLTSYRRFAPERWGYALLGRTMLRRLDLGLCASNELRELLIGLGVPEHKLMVHHLGIDLEKFVPGAARAREPVRVMRVMRVIMVGRFAPKKGFVYGLRAFARAQQQYPELSLRVIGDGEERPLLEALIRDERVQNVELLGQRSPDEIVRELQAAHVLLAPSVTLADRNRESGLIVAKEASACGVVPIGSEHGGIPEIIDDGVTGFLVPERDVEAMAQRIVTLVRDPSLRERFALAARAKMERQYDQRVRVAALEDHYDALVERHLGRGSRAR